MQAQLSKTTYGLIGHPLAHSQSKDFFTKLFASQESEETYDNYDLSELTPQALYSILLLNPELRGFNVTAPYKLAIMDYLDELTDEASAVGAVNCVKVLRDDTKRVCALVGHNTDVEGFRKSVEPFAARLKAGQGALILGTGGASKAVAEALRRLGVPFCFVSRSKKSGVMTYDEIDAETLRNNPLIINATPMGTYPHTAECPPLPYHLMDASTMCHDLVYNPAETEFMKQAAKHEASVKNGLEMLHNQALASLDFWKQ